MGLAHVCSSLPSLTPPSETLDESGWLWGGEPCVCGRGRRLAVYVCAGACLCVGAAPNTDSNKDSFTDSNKDSNKDSNAVVVHSRVPWRCLKARAGPLILCFSMVC